MSGINSKTHLVSSQSLSIELPSFLVSELNSICESMNFDSILDAIILLLIRNSDKDSD